MATSAVVDRVATTRVARLVVITGLLLVLLLASPFEAFAGRHVWFFGGFLDFVTIDDNDWQRSPWTGTRRGGYISSAHRPASLNYLRLMTANFEGPWLSTAANSSYIYWEHAPVWGRTRCTGSLLYSSEIGIACQEFR